ncbi:MAG: hypothetical protein ABR555_08165 [Pyrinomonadaceae bacterium]
MFCPQCGTESPDGLQYCRNCGANLKVIGKAVALSEAIARSDHGPLPKIREMVKGLKVEHVTDEVSGTLEKMNHEIARISPESYKRPKHWLNFRKKKTAEERREEHIVKGLVSFFSGIGLTVFLYYLSAALVLKLPPHIIEQIPFEIGPVVRVLWLVGLIPALSGLGHIIAGLTIKTSPKANLHSVSSPKPLLPIETQSSSTHTSVTEHTTELLRPQQYE